MSNKKIPNFLVIGTPKAGTTSIAAYLGEHPDIFISEEKEPQYFIAEIIKRLPKDDPLFDHMMKIARLEWQDYLELFANSKNEKFRGEATVHYLYHYDTVIPKVKDRLGDIPIILILRDPVTRAFSNYTFQNRDQTCSFEEALELEEERKNKGWNSFWYYKEEGKYCAPVTAYLDNFSNVYIGTFEDFKKDSIKFMQDIYEFLGVDKTFLPNVIKKHNTTMVPQNRFILWIYYLQHKYGINTGLLPKSLKREFRKRFFKKSDQQLLPKTEKYLYHFFEDDIRCLEKKTGLDLNQWKKH